jgi:hypothetical protein
MADCFLTQGFTLQCNEGIGGVKEVFLSNWENFESGVVLTAGVVTTLPTATIYRYQPNRSTGALTMTPNQNLENGTLFFTQAVEFTLGKLDPDKHIEFNTLSKAKLAVFVRLYDDQILFVGRTDGGFLTAGTYQSGKAKGDMSGYMCTITAEEPELCPFLDQFDVATETPFENFAGISVIPAY